MRRWSVYFAMTWALIGCGDDADDAFGGKKAMPMDQVPAVVLEAAKKAAPDLTFYAAYKDQFEGQDSIELKGKTKSGKIKEIEVSPTGNSSGPNKGDSIADHSRTRDQFPFRSRIRVVRWFNPDPMNRFRFERPRPSSLFASR